MNRVQRRAAKKKTVKSYAELAEENKQNHKIMKDVYSNVVVSSLCPGEMSSTFVFSLDRLLLYEQQRTGKVIYRLIEFRTSTGALVETRNRLALDFMNLPHMPEWNLMIDSDMGFPHDSLERLLQSADPIERPVIGGLAFRHCKLGPVDPSTMAVEYGCVPTIYRYIEKHDDDGKTTEAGFQHITDYPRDSLVQTAGSGCAFLLVHRSVYEKIAKKYQEQFAQGELWFSQLKHPIAKTQQGLPTRFSEDLSFCIRCYGADVPIFVDTSVKTAHDKGGIVLDERQWDAQQFLIENYPPYVERAEQFVEEGLKESENPDELIRVD